MPDRVAVKPFCGAVLAASLGLFSVQANAAGGVGFVFGSSRALNCVFTRTDGIGERYTGTIKRFGVDLGFTRESTIV